MPKFARYDSNIKIQSKVIGWYNTDERKYNNFPDANDLLQITEEQWLDHKENPSCWAVTNQQLVRYNNPVLPSIDVQAQLMLMKGCQIESKTHETMNGLYKCDETSLHSLMNTAIHIKFWDKFPGQSLTYSIITAENKLVEFSSTVAFIDLVKAISDYVSDLNSIINGKSTVLPIQPIVIL